MMYTFPNKLRNLAFAFMAVGFIGLVYGFLSAPTTIEEAKAIVAANHGEGHGTSHDTPSDHAEESAHSKETSHDTDAAHSQDDSHNSGHTDSHDAEHDEHVFHQLTNKPWAALYVAAFFFLYDLLGSFSILCNPTRGSSRMVSSTIQSDGKYYSIFTSRRNYCSCHLSPFRNAYEPSVYLDGSGSSRS